MRLVSFALFAVAVGLAVTGCGGAETSSAPGAEGPSGPNDDSAPNAAENTDESTSGLSGSGRSLTGVLATHYAIGSETTGFAVQLPNGKLVEIDLVTNRLTRLFADGASVTLRGSYKTVRGLEIPTRKVFFVQSLVVNASQLNAEGEFEQLYAIGAETTGFGLNVGTKSIELDLKTNGLQRQFVVGRHVKITGSYATVRGVEIPVRQVLVVKTITR